MDFSQILITKFVIVSIFSLQSSSSQDLTGAGLVWSAVMRLVGEILETALDKAYQREMNISFMGNNSGGHFCSQHANTI